MKYQVGSRLIKIVRDDKYADLITGVFFLSLFVPHDSLHDSIHEYKCKEKY